MNDTRPPEWALPLRDLPHFTETVRWDRLRHGVDSEVWRVTLSSGRTLIAKRGARFEAQEAAVYQCLLDPLGVQHPAIYATGCAGDTQVSLVEDVGCETVDQRPTAHHFADAARSLAEIRCTAAERLESDALPPAVRAAYYKSAEHYVMSVRRTLDIASLDRPQRLALARLRNRLPSHLERLYATACVTLTHNDYNAKNLVLTDHGVVAIDWSHAELTPHLGDLYCLLRDAARHGVAESDVVDAYLTHHPVPEVSWHIQMGGLCWLIRGLQWAWDPRNQVSDVKQLTRGMIRAAAECLDQLE